MTDFDRFGALSFDCYGTLIDWEAGIAAELVPWAARAGVTATADELIEVFASIESQVQAERPTTRYPDVLGITLERIGDHYGVAVSDDDRRDFGASVGRWPAFPDSAGALARLATRFELVIVSNVDRASFALSNARLGVDFDLVITAEDVGSYKPSPGHFTALFDRLGELSVTRAELLHVAQSLYHDHEPARAFGLASVWIDRRHDKAGFGATPPPADTLVAVAWRFPSMAAFADAAGV